MPPFLFTSNVPAESAEDRLSCRSIKDVIAAMSASPQAIPADDGDDDDDVEAPYIPPAVPRIFVHPVNAEGKFRRPHGVPRLSIFSIIEEERSGVDHLVKSRPFWPSVCRYRADVIIATHEGQARITKSRHPELLRWSSFPASNIPARMELINQYFAERAAAADDGKEAE